MSGHYGICERSVIDQCNTLSESISPACIDHYIWTQEPATRIEIHPSRLLSALPRLSVPLRPKEEYKAENLSILYVILSRRFICRYRLLWILQTFCGNSAQSK